MTDDSGAEVDPVHLTEFYWALGTCLTAWQTVEFWLFMIFWRLTQYGDIELPSLMFNHIRAFDQRRVLVDRFAHATLTDLPETLKRWESLHKRLTVCGSKRDRIVHYQIMRATDDSPRIRIEPPSWSYKLRWGPTKIGPRDDSHCLDAESLYAIKAEFILLSKDLEQLDDELEAASEAIQNTIEKGPLPT